MVFTGWPMLHRSLGTKGEMRFKMKLMILAPQKQQFPDRLPGYFSSSALSLVPSSFFITCSAFPLVVPQDLSQHQVTAFPWDITLLLFWEGLFQGLLPTCTMDETAPSFFPYIPQIYIRALCTTKTLPTIYEHMPPTPVLQTKALGLCGEDPTLETVMQTAEWTFCCNMHICTNVFYGL